MSHRAPDHEAGFTLVETLIALFVVAILAGAGATLMVSSMNAGRSVEEASSRIGQLDILRALIREDLNAATLRASTSASGFEPPTVFSLPRSSGDGELMTFVRNGWLGATEGGLRSDLQRVSYRFEDGQLIRRAWARADPSSATSEVDLVLADGLERVELRVYADDQWGDAWIVPANDPAPRLPDLVEINLVFEDDRILSQRVSTR